MPTPPEPEPTVADLAERFLHVHLKVNRKPSTAATYRGHLDCHILPARGRGRSARSDAARSRRCITGFATRLPPPMRS